MKLCLNPDCQKPQNPDFLDYCHYCGKTLLLKNRYRAIQAIGQGGFGRTFLAIDEDKPSKPRCVIKQFFPSAQGTRHQKKAAELFEQEAERLEDLGIHDQIPALLAHFSQEQRQYLVQEWIDGKNLAALLAEQGALTEAKIQTVLLSLLPVLQFVHSHRVIHRDIKPSNIICVSGSPIAVQRHLNQPDWASLLQALSMETAQGFRDGTRQSFRFSQWLEHSLSQPPNEFAIADASRWQQLAHQFGRYPLLTFSERQYLVADASRILYEMRRKYEQSSGEILPVKLVLVDFGAAKVTAKTAPSRTGTMIGSPEYIAPEQARGKAVFASDLYSLGVTCIQLLTNISPLDLFDTQDNTWIWRRYLQTPVSDRLGQILDKLLEPGLNRRYASAIEVLNALDQQGAVLASPAVPLPTTLGTSTPSNALLPNALPSPPVFSQQQPAQASQSTPRQQSGRRAARKPSAWEWVQTLTTTGKVVAIALSPTEPIVISSSGTSIRLWNLQTGQPIRTLTGHLDIVHALTISPNGRLLISGSADKSIRLWDLQTGKRLGTILAHTDTVLSLAISPDGTSFVSGSLYDPLKHWDLNLGQEKNSLGGHAGRIMAIAFSPDGNTIASGSADSTVKLWSSSTAVEQCTLKDHTQAIAALAFSSDNKTLASGSWDGTVKLWSTRTHKLKRTLDCSSGRVNSVAFSPDGKVLAVGSDTLTLWSPRTGKTLATFTGHTSPISAVVFGILPRASLEKPQLALISASWDNTIQIWRSQ